MSENQIQLKGWPAIAVGVIAVIFLGLWLDRHRLASRLWIAMSFLDFLFVLTQLLF